MVEYNQRTGDTAMESEDQSEVDANERRRAATEAKSPGPKSPRKGTSKRASTKRAKSGPETQTEDTLPDEADDAATAGEEQTRDFQSISPGTANAYPEETALDRADTYERAEVSDPSVDALNAQDESHDDGLDDDDVQDNDHDQGPPEFGARNAKAPPAPVKTPPPVPSYALQTTGSLWATFAVNSTVFRPLHAPARGQANRPGPANQISVSTNLPALSGNSPEKGYERDTDDDDEQNQLENTADHVKNVASDIDSYVRDPADDWDEEEDLADEPIVFEDENHQAPRMVPTFLTSQDPTAGSEGGETTGETSADTGEDTRADEVSDRESRRRLSAGRLAPRNNGDAKSALSLRPRGRKARVRMPETPKWSESAKNHMTNMLASSPADLSSTIPSQSTSFVHDRGRVSAAAMLLGLPALMLVGFAAAYVFQAYNPTTKQAVLNTDQSSSSANILGLKATSDPAPKQIIVAKSQSTVTKQQETAAVVVEQQAEAPLPPPVAPPLASLEPLDASSGEPASAQTSAGVVQPGLTEADKALKPDDAPAPVKVAQARPVIEPTASTPQKSTNILPEGLGFSLLKRAPADPGPAVEPKAAEPAAAEWTAKPEVAANKVKPKAAGRMYAALNPSASTTLPAATTPPATAAKLSAAPATDDASGEADQLVKRGRLLLGMGDIVSARLILSLAVENGKSEAAGSLARTFDPVYFERLGVHGVKPDPIEAQKWYRKAAKLGDDTALVDMQALKAWQTQNASQ